MLRFLFISFLILFVTATSFAQTAPKEIARVLSDGIQRRVHADPRSFVRADGTLDLDVLLREFASFWIEQGDVLVEGATYREAGAQLVLMAFLQRVVNGGGTVTREYGAGRKRLDLLVEWPHTDGSGKLNLRLGETK